MATTAGTGIGSGPGARKRSWRLGGRTRKTVLVIHIASVGCWLGIDVVMAVLVFTALFSDSDSTKALSYQALELVAVWPMTVSALLCLGTGLLLGLGSKYGLVKYWWVAVKLALNLLLTTLVLVALKPAVRLAADEGRSFEAGHDASLAPGDLVFPPIVSPSLLMVAVVLSVFKPWGRLRKDRQR